jgi:hypothetical protein
VGGGGERDSTSTVLGSAVEIFGTLNNYNVRRDEKFGDKLGWTFNYISPNRNPEPVTGRAAAAQNVRTELGFFAVA